MADKYNDMEYRKRQADCDCLSPGRRAFIDQAIAFTSDFNDGAFMAYMDEQGIDVSELEAFSIEHDCAKEKKPAEVQP